MLKINYKFSLLGFAVVLLLACGLDQGAGTPNSAVGDTPVKAVVCSQGDVNCFVVARYSDLDSCEYHRKLSSMSCDSLSSNDKIFCESIDPVRLMETPSYCIEE